MDGGGGGDGAMTADLVRRARGGDRAAFSALIVRYERTALAVAFAAAGDATLAGDATQDAFLRAWEGLATLKENARFGPWLCGIVRNRAIDLRRGVRRLGLIGITDERSGADPAAELDRAESVDQVSAALESLDDTSRTMVVLRYYEEMPSSAIAVLLGTTPAAVDMRLSRARSTLRQLLTPQRSER